MIRGTKENSEGDVFHGHHLHQIPIWTGLRIAFLASYCVNNSGTDMLKQYGDFGTILDVIDGYFPIFPYKFIHRTEEIAGSNPARSTGVSLGKGVLFMIQAARVRAPTQQMSK